MKRFVLLCFFFLVALEVQATTILQKDFDVLVAEAEGIVGGTVQKIESHDDQNREIYTFVTLGDLDVIHGAYVQPTLVLQLKGGQVGRNTVESLGSPKFSPEERVIVFIQGNGTKMVPLVGWTQGMFRIVTNNASGRSTIRDHQGNRVLGIEGRQLLKDSRHPRKYMADPGQPDEVGPSEFGQASKEAEPQPKEGMSLETFRRAIVERVQQQDKEPLTIKSVNISEFRMVGHRKHKPDAPSPGM